MSHRVHRPLLVPALAVLTALVGVLALAGSAGAATSKPRLLVYGGANGVYVQRAVNVDRRLPGAPADFRAFVKRTIRHLHAVDHCDAAAIGVSVNRVRTDGFARGAVSDCGGYAALWKRVDGRWRQVIGTQDIWRCRDLRALGVPSSVVGPKPRCAVGARTVVYRHA